MSDIRFHIRYCSLENLPYVEDAIDEATSRDLCSLGVYKKETREFLFELSRCDLTPKEQRQMKGDCIYINTEKKDEM